MTDAERIEALEAENAELRATLRAALMTALRCIDVGRLGTNDEPGWRWDEELKDYVRV